MWSSLVWLQVRTTVLWPTSPSQPSPWLLPRNRPLSVSRLCPNQVRGKLPLAIIFLFQIYFSKIEVFNDEKTS